MYFQNINVQGTVGKGIKYIVITKIDPTELHAKLIEKFTPEFGTQISIQYNERSYSSEFNLSEAKDYDYILAI